MCGPESAILFLVQVGERGSTEVRVRVIRCSDSLLQAQLGISLS